MGTYGFYRLDAGINYRDKRKAINELSTGENVRWYADALTRRKGYQARAATLTLPSAQGFHVSADVLNIIDHLHYKDGTTERYFLFVSIDAGGGTTADQIVVYEASAIPTTASAAFTPIGGTAADDYMMPWTVADAFDVVQKFDKAYICTDDNNPYALHLNTAGTSFFTTELPLCDVDNASASQGYSAGDAIIISANWDGCQWVEEVETVLYLCDGTRMFYALCEDYDHDPAIDITGTAGEQMAGVAQTWGPDRYKMVEGGKPHTAASYHTYVILGGKKSTWRWIGRDIINDDTFLDEISDRPVHGEILACPAGVFWVSDDGIYFYNGSTVNPISGKIWEHIKTQHATLPADLDDCSLVYYKGWVWISFPNSTDKEIWVFKPFSMYQGDDGEMYATFFKYIHKITDLDTKKSFSVLRVIEDRLFATDGAQLYELDVGFLDIDQGINTLFETSDLDFNAPNKKKVYGDFLLECDANLETILTHVITFSRDYGEQSVSITGIDTTYTSAKRAKVEKRITYHVDGNALVVKVVGTAPSASAGTGEVRYFGVSIDASIEDESIIERE